MVGSGSPRAGSAADREPETGGSPASTAAAGPVTRWLPFVLWLTVAPVLVAAVLAPDLLWLAPLVLLFVADQVALARLRRRTPLTEEAFDDVAREEDVEPLAELDDDAGTLDHVLFGLEHADLVDAARYRFRAALRLRLAATAVQAIGWPLLALSVAETPGIAVEPAHPTLAAVAVVLIAVSFRSVLTRLVAGLEPRLRTRSTRAERRRALRTADRAEYAIGAVTIAIVLVRWLA